jgi:Flp pilus assembly protein CpaB
MAVLAFGGVFLLGNTLGGGGGGAASSAKIVVAKTDIPLRHIIVDSDLDFANVSAVGPIYTTKADVITKISQIKITKGSVITGDMLATDINVVPGGAAPAYLPLPSGYVAMTIPTGELQGVAGHISVGDYITVVASSSVSIFAGAPGAPTAPAGPPKIVTKTVFRDLRVIGLGPAAANVQPAGGAAAGGSAAPTTGVTSSLTIVLSQCDAEYFTWFLNNMSLRYTLQSYKDYLKTPLGDNSDPNCKNISDASGVTQYKVDARYKFTTT